MIDQRRRRALLRAARAAARARAMVSHRMHFAIRFLTEYRLRRCRRRTTSTRCACGPRRPHRSAATSSIRGIEPEARRQPPPRLLRHRGDRVRDHPPSHEELTIDVRARVVTSAPPEPPARLVGSLDEPAYIDAGGEFAAADRQDQPAIRGLDELARRARLRHPAGALRTALRADPRPLRIPPRRDVRRLAGQRSAGGRRRRLPGLRAPLL